MRPAVEPGSTRDDGAVALVTMAAAALVLLTSLAVLASGQFLAGRARAQAAADAAALAAAPVTFRPFGATGTAAEEAAAFAAANGATVVRCRCPQNPSWDTRTVVVTVRHAVPVVLFGTRFVEATAWAEFAPVRLLD